jgi:AbrB family looped-hinge helix DNA binding protein
VLVSKITGKGQVTIPRQVREKLMAKAGDFVAFDLTRDGVSIRGAAPLDSNWLPALAGTLAEWTSPEDEEAWREL